MLRRNKAAMTRERKENATWPTIKTFEKVTRRRPLPVERVSSLRVSAMAERDARSAGATPKTNPEATEMPKAKTKTVAFRFGAIKLDDTSAGRNDQSSRAPK